MNVSLSSLSLSLHHGTRNTAEHVARAVLRVFVRTRTHDRMAKISQEVAIAIFVAKKRRAHRSRRDNLASTLAARYGITSRSVRGIWNLRTWAHATQPFWTTDDHKIFLSKHGDQLEENQIGQGEEDHQALSEADVEASSYTSLAPFCTFTKRGCELYRASVWNRANNLHNNLLEEALRCFE